MQRHSVWSLKCCFKDKPLSHLWQLQSVPGGGCQTFNRMFHIIIHFSIVMTQNVIIALLFHGETLATPLAFAHTASTPTSRLVLSIKCPIWAKCRKTFYKSNEKINTNPTTELQKSKRKKEKLFFPTRKSKFQGIPLQINCPQ